MYVTRVEITGFQDDSPEGAQRGTVALVANDRRLKVALSSPHRVEIMRRQHRLRLLTQALQSVRRLPDPPEPDEIRFAPGILPFGLTRVDLTAEQARRKSG